MFRKLVSLEFSELLTINYEITCVRTFEKIFELAKNANTRRSLSEKRRAKRAINKQFSTIILLKLCGSLFLMRIAVSIIGQTVDEQRRDIDSAVLQGANIVEVRFDYLRREEQTVKNVEILLRHNAIPKIYTNRHISQAGHDKRAGFKGSEEERLELVQAAADLNAEFIDVEKGYELKWRGKSSYILSFHDFEEMPSDIELKIIHDSMIRDANGRYSDIIKMAAKANSPSDWLRMLNFTAERCAFDYHSERPEFIGICMGPYGVPTRVLGPSLGSYLTFASLEGKSSALGQPTITELKKAERLLQLNA